jgi:hypothetical protein
MSNASSPRIHILDMIAEGRLSAEEGVQLLEALAQSKGSAEKQNPIPKPISTGMVLIRIIEKGNRKTLASIRIPLSLFTTARKFGAKITAHDEEFNLDEFQDRLHSSQPGDVFRVEKEKEVIELIVE